MDFIAGIFELFGNWNIGNKRKIGFILNVIGCSVWIYVAFHSRVYGLLIVVVPAIAINIRNYMKWKSSKRLSMKKSGGK